MIDLDEIDIKADVSDKVSRRTRLAFRKFLHRSRRNTIRQRVNVSRKGREPSLPKLKCTE